MRRLSKQSTQSRPNPSNSRTAHQNVQSPTLPPTRHHLTQSDGMDSRCRRVRKACERCRTKKVKCDGEIPCRRCKDDRAACAAVVRKIKYKQLPQGYAQVLETSQFALVATAQKLYSMVRNNQPWELGEPGLSDHGLPVMHNIAEQLRCIRTDSETDPPVNSVCRENETGMAEVASQLEKQKELGLRNDVKDTDSSADKRTERALPSEPDHSPFELDNKNAVFGNYTTMTVSLQILASGNDPKFRPSPHGMDASIMASSQPPSIINFMARTVDKAHPNDLTTYFSQEDREGQNINILNSEFHTINPHVLLCAKTKTTMRMNDPMIYSGYDGEPI